MREQTVAISQLEMEVQFRNGELIHTENSYKYDCPTSRSWQVKQGLLARIPGWIKSNSSAAIYCWPFERNRQDLHDEQDREKFQNAKRRERLIRASFGLAVVLKSCH